MVQFKKHNANQTLDAQIYFKRSLNRKKIEQGQVQFCYIWEQVVNPSLRLFSSFK